MQLLIHTATAPKVQNAKRWSECRLEILSIMCECMRVSGWCIWLIYLPTFFRSIYLRIQNHREKWPVLEFPFLFGASQPLTEVIKCNFEEDITDLWRNFFSGMVTILVLTCGGLSVASFGQKNKTKRKASFLISLCTSYFRLLHNF